MSSESGNAGHAVLAVDAGRVAELFRLLGDQTRTSILYALLEQRELSAADLARAARVSETSASHALRLLRTARVVRSHREGRTVYYSLQDQHVRMLLELAGSS
ncbi:MAG: ArsR/SmtB family transcription factor [Actinomycetota bacterium]